MDKLSKKLIYTLTGILYGMMVSLPAVAEDIEIYTTGSSVVPGAQPNLLFVLDTSGSMGGPVVDRAPYNPATDYSGGDACYDVNRVYAMKLNWDFASANVAGQTNAELLCVLGTATFNSYVRQFNRTAVVCNAANSLEGVGFYTGVISQFRSANWDADLAVNDLTAFVECEADRGVHGEDAAATARWANRNSLPAWSALESDEINWEANGVSKSIFTGNYLNYLINAPINSMRTRIDIMKGVMNDLVASVTGINIGLMRFSDNGAGGMMVLPVADIGPVPDPSIGIIAGSQRDSFIAEMNKMTANSNTPLSESFYEAVMYFQGGAVDYGLSSTEGGGTAYPSVPASRSGNTYISPITMECQKNFVVLLTDGDPSDDILDATRRGRIGSDVTGCGDIDNNCLDEIARSIGTNDQSPLVGDQVISTFTVGFGNENPLLQTTADESKAATDTGERFFADNAATLASRFSAIVANIFDTDTTFAAPAVSVNAFNRSTHLNDLYFTLFKPATGNHWPGNLKKYELKFEVDITDKDGDGNTTELIPFIADASGNHAVNDGSGYFDASATSFWSDLVDGSTVTLGGAANEFQNLSPSPRKVYTFSGDYNNTDGVFKPIANAVLANTANRVVGTNSAIRDEAGMLDIAGLPDKIATVPITPRRATLLNWAAGFDVFDRHGVVGDTTDMRPGMGSPLHSQPALVQYGGTTSSPDIVAYVATNDGYLHAYSATDGKELFSFIPQELLSNLNVLMDNSSSDKVYGLDGDVVAWVEDTNGDGHIAGADEHVYLYFGMRRGGKNIYALDVTDRNDPKLMWVIKGGEGDYVELGDTWSSINVEKVKDGGGEKTVLIFGGGYDDQQDSVTVRTGDTVGRAVFIANAETGARLWMGGAGGGDMVISEMNYSIPARIKPLDISGDGFVDRLYAVDMGGQIFRFDIDNTNGTALAGSIIGGRIADLAGPTDVEARRFYYPPDVALVDDVSGKYHGLVIGSGFRARPLNDVIQDRIYMLKDKHTGRIISAGDYLTLTEAQLKDVTDNLAGGDGADDVVRDNELGNIAAKDGWYIKLDDGSSSSNWVGEKVLAEALIIEGRAIVSTYLPDLSPSVGSCGPKPGDGKVFFLDIIDATPALAPPSATDKRPERHIELKRGGIPPSPNVIITADRVPTLCVGTECQQADFGLGVRKTFWYEVEN